MGSGHRCQVDPQTADGGTRDGGQKSADAPVDPESEGEPVELGASVPAVKHPCAVWHSSCCSASMVGLAGRNGVRLPLSRPLVLATLEHDAQREARDHQDSAGLRCGLSVVVVVHSRSEAQALHHGGRPARFTPRPLLGSRVLRTSSRRPENPNSRSFAAQATRRVSAPTPPAGLRRRSPQLRATAARRGSLPSPPLPARNQAC